MNASRNDNTTRLVSSNGTGSERTRNQGISQLFVVICCVIYTLIITAALLGNLLICLAVLSNKILRMSVTTYFIFSLAMSDLLTAILVMPFDLEILLTKWKWRHGEIFCDVWTTAYLFTVPSSILNLLVLSVDRYKALSDPLDRYKESPFVTHKRALVVIATLWCYSILFSLVPLMGWRANEQSVHNNICYFNTTFEYSLISSAVNFLLPLLAMCWIYLKIFRIVKRVRKPPTSQAPREHDDNKPVEEAASSQKKRRDLVKNTRAAKTISLIVCAFFFSWVPHTVNSVIMNLCIVCDIPYQVPVVFLMMGYLNSALNPVLYTFHNPHFRKVFSSFLRLMSSWKFVARHKEPLQRAPPRFTHRSASSLPLPNSHGISLTSFKEITSV